jgi:hypothetical protein
VDGVSLFDEMDKLQKEHPSWESFIIEDKNEWTTYRLSRERDEINHTS